MESKALLCSLSSSEKEWIEESTQATTAIHSGWVGCGMRLTGCQSVTTATVALCFRHTGALEYSHRNVVFLSLQWTSHDTRNKVGLWGVMIHIESWAKSNQGQLVELSGLLFLLSTLRGVQPVLCYSGEIHILLNSGPRFDFSNKWCYSILWA